jgi:hypothetical protein
MRQRIATVALLLGVAITTVLGTAQAAQAGTDIIVGYYSGQLASSVSFYAYGERGQVCDWKADGHSAVGVVEWWDAPSRVWRVVAVVWASRGSDTCESYNVGIVDGIRVRAHACIGERAGNYVIACGEWREGEA